MAPTQRVGKDLDLKFNDKKVKLTKFFYINFRFSSWFWKGNMNLSLIYPNGTFSFQLWPALKLQLCTFSCGIYYFSWCPVSYHQLFGFNFKYFEIYRCKFEFYTEHCTVDTFQLFKIKLFQPVQGKIKVSSWVWCKSPFSKR